MVFSATFNNISVISWWLVLLVEETAGPGENHRPSASHWQLYIIMLYISTWAGVEPSSVVIVTDYLGSCKSNYHAITATTAPNYNMVFCHIGPGIIPRLQYQPKTIAEDWYGSIGMLPGPMWKKHVIIFIYHHPFDYYR